ncbi:MAG: nicotinamide-nucleotide amidohydrolase family protein [Magnetococcales bacterium]|nr:nicotinamide-nucleotide amidohydrolase family protein [Magnetococcales bacterium]
MIKCLLVVPRWSDLETLLPLSGRPYLDLFLHGLGVSDIATLEVDPEEPFDPNDTSPEYGLIIAQGEHGGRLRRSFISNLGLSLGLDGEESDQLRVLGAKRLETAAGVTAGFAVRRRGRMVAFCEHSIWEVRHDLVSTIRTFLEEERSERRRRAPSCWMVEGGSKKPDLSDLTEGELCLNCTLQSMPGGDWAMTLPASMGPEVRQRVEERLGESLYAKEPVFLEEEVARIFRESGLRLAVAESCTSGLVSARLASVPGSSAFLLGGVVAYANALKQGLLEVPESLVQSCGAVSMEVALSMARGVQRTTEADMGLSITGIAGPDGGSEEKPVGTVFMAAVSRWGKVMERSFRFPGDRNRIRQQASQAGLHLLRHLLAAGI